MNRACFPILSSLLGTLLLAGCGTVSVVDSDASPLPDADLNTPDGGANPALCGNNMPDLGETCDDGNKNSGDGCSEACLDEANFCDPKAVGNIYSMSNDGGRMVAEGDYLYLSAAPFISAPTFRVLDVSNPNSVSEVSSFQHDDRPNARVGGLIKRGNRIWLAGNDPGLTSIDVTDPTNAQLGGLDLNPSTDGHIARIGENFIFVSHSVSERPQIHDITTQTPISLVTLGDAGDVYYNVGASDTLAFASTSSNSVDIFSGTDNPVTATVAGRYEHATPWNSSSAVAKILATDNILILAVTGTAGGIHLVDIGIPSAPVFISTIPETPTDIAVIGNYIYVPRSDGLRVYDISDPANPVTAGSILNFTFDASAIAVDGNRAYAISENDLMIVEGLPGICQPICGNNAQEYTEACDDGNRVDGDGCSADCSSSS